MSKFTKRFGSNEYNCIPENPFIFLQIRDLGSLQYNIQHGYFRYYLLNIDGRECSLEVFIERTLNVSECEFNSNNQIQVEIQPSLQQTGWPRFGFSSP